MQLIINLINISISYKFEVDYGIATMLDVLPKGRKVNGTWLLA
ncbi:protein of unknown function [Moritella yayanosii]|uniref:Uncharacterized protein n=1 Tax=Moritella yayanosii TaxID=69539 RepID=A0A330LK51_9GAMM|nr:protein of unknown function [Moritella yayanosii]